MKATETLTLNRVIDRPSLRAVLDGVLGKRLALIVAPAGAGKSTLIAQWAASRPAVDVEFVDLEGTDEGPSVLASALPVASNDGEGLVTGGSATDPDATGVDGEPADRVVVLDDLHDYMTAELAETLSNAIEHLPPKAHLILSTRAEPPLRLSKLRLDGDILELRQADLALAEDEALHVLEAVLDHPVDADGVRTVLDRTEGWAAGVQLAALELQHHEDEDGFLAEFSGNDRLIADYLWEEVFRVLPSALHELILSASVLDVMSADIVDEVTGCGLGTALHLFETLERESLFLVPLDSHREWYRFHHLVLDLLRYRLRFEHEEMRPVLLRKAAEWYLRRQQVPPAIEYLVRARDWGPAAELLRLHRADLDLLGQGDTVRRWLIQIPEPLQLAVDGQENRGAGLFRVEPAVRSARLQEVRSRPQDGPGRDDWATVTDVHAHVPRAQRGFAAISGLEDGWLVSDAGARSVTMDIASDAVSPGAAAVVPNGFGVHLRPVPAGAAVPGLADPLTFRERELLEYLPTRLTNSEIAKRLYVSINTVKTHMAHIYRKLGVTSRDAAIERAMEIGLIAGRPTDPLLGLQRAL